MRKYIIIIILFLGFSSIANGQIQRKKNSVFRIDRTELGLGVGTTFYLGDYSEFTPFIEPRYYGSIFHRYYFNLLYSLRTTISFGNIAGNSSRYTGEMPYYDLKYPYGRPTINFSRNFIDFSTGVEIGFKPFEPVMHRLNQRFAPYVFIGVGIMMLYPDSHATTAEAKAASSSYPRIYGTNDDNSSAIQIFNIPVALGFKYSPWAKWTIGVEWQFKKTFNDDIDRFNNIKASEINNFEKGSVLTNTDWVSFLGVNVSYRLSVKAKCPAVKRPVFSDRKYKGINRDYNLHDNANKANKKKK